MTVFQPYHSFISPQRETIGKAIGRKEKGRGSKEGKVKGTDSDKNNLPVNIWDWQEKLYSLRIQTNGSKVGGSL